MIDLSDLDTARARLRIPVRPRDRSADNILLATHTNTEVPENPPFIIPKFTSPMQRSVSFKRPHEINKGESFNRPILKSNKEDNQSITPKPIENEIISNDLSSENENLSSQNENNNNSKQSMSRSSSQEHIYDNLDVFKRSKPNVDLSLNEDEPSVIPIVKTREHSLPKTRLRPVTMHLSPNNEKQITNEFENVFNQLKKRGSVRRVRPNEEPLPEPPPPPVEELPPSPPPQPENEPIIAVTKPLETAPTPPTPSRRKTVGGVHLPANNKVASDDIKPTPSWIDIAKQKQNKL